jgi:hypothetical protein
MHKAACSGSYHETWQLAAELAFLLQDSLLECPPAQAQGVEDLLVDLSPLERSLSAYNKCQGPWLLGCQDGCIPFHVLSAVQLVIVRLA